MGILSLSILYRQPDSDYSECFNFKGGEIERNLSVFNGEPAYDLLLEIGLENLCRSLGERERSTCLLSVILAKAKDVAVFVAGGFCSGNSNVRAGKTGHLGESVATLCRKELCVVRRRVKNGTVVRKALAVGGKSVFEMVVFL